MDEPDDVTEAQFAVVVNHEEQHSIWAVDHEVPDGWRQTGFRGTRQQCLDHIAEVWTDITPRSVRQARQST
jgi:MbtH protein